MMRTIHFYIPRKKNTWNTIRYKFTLNYETITGTTGIKIATINWDFKKTKAKPSYKSASNVNQSLLKLEEEILSILADLNLNDSLNKESFQLRINSKSQQPSLDMSIFKFYDEYLIPDKKNEGKKLGTIKSYKNSHHKLLQYCEYKKIKPVNLTLKRIMEYSFYTDYLGFLNHHCGYTLNYQGGFIKQLITLVSHSRSLGFHNQILHKNFKKPNESVEPIILEKNELQLLSNCNSLTELEELARDWFLISCDTSLRISDFFGINSNKIDYDRNLISLRMVKNSNKHVHIPMSKTVLRILNKHCGVPKTMSEAIFNTHIKLACEKAGITNVIQIERVIKGKIRIEQIPKFQKISAHCGRRTFATHAFEDQLLDLKDLMLITGHSDIKTLMLYIRVDSKQVATKMQQRMDELGM